MAKDLFGAWSDFESRLNASRRVCILTDYDGTLTRFAELPGLAELSSHARRTLSLLAKNKQAIVGVVSGRALPDVRERVRLTGIWYVGNHGYEISDPEGKEHRFYDQKDLDLMQKIHDELAEEARRIPGVLLEHKGPVVAMHYRLVETVSASEVQRAFHNVISRHQRSVMIGRGHLVLEARLRGNCNKGTAVRFIARELPRATLVVYFGDDNTDRDAFRAVLRMGVSVSVGDGLGFTDFSLPGPDAVIRALSQIDSTLREKKIEERTPAKGVLRRQNNR